MNPTDNFPTLEILDELYERLSKLADEHNKIWPTNDPENKRGALMGQIAEELAQYLVNNQTEADALCRFEEIDGYPFLHNPHIPSGTEDYNNFMRLVISKLSKLKSTPNPNNGALTNVVDPTRRGVERLTNE